MPQFLPLPKTTVAATEDNGFFEERDEGAFLKPSTSTSTPLASFLTSVTVYTSGCDANLAPTCQNLEGEFDHRSTAVCSCGEFEVPIGTLACFAEPEIYVETCEDYMDVDNSDDACAASKVCKLAEQGWAASWFFVRECIPKETAEILEVETVTDVKNDANGVDVEVEGFKKAPSSRSSKKPLSSVAATVVLGKGKNCGILPCFVFEYKFYFIGGLGAISALLLMLIAIKCCSRRRAKE
jgi:hypothetical protein